MTKVKVDQWLTRDNLRRLFVWAQSGYPDSELANLMNIHRATFYKWREKYSAISDTITRGRAHACDVVENELFERAKSKTVQLTEEVKVRQVEYDPVSGRKIREIEDVAPLVKEVYVPADVRAQIYFLNNRRPEDWGEKRTVELGDKAADALRQPSLTLAERKALLTEMQSMIDPLADGELGDVSTSSPSANLSSPNGSSPGKRRGTAPSSGK